MVAIELNIIICVILNSMWSYKTVCVINCIEYVEYNGKSVVGIIALNIDDILTVLKVFVFREYSSLLLARFPTPRIQSRLPYGGMRPSGAFY